MLTIGGYWCMILAFPGSQGYNQNMSRNMYGLYEVPENTGAKAPQECKVLREKALGSRMQVSTVGSN
ncbi:unnamed protein product [Gongylonema pulchrum]|uniref:Secreted protein n=1 Tax=Gongylonema pulchrum TaxID=637853 RepID=A0A183DDP0_9BILA|nr:unnamed protein product [Gongylonema pulchrum]